MQVTRSTKQKKIATNHAADSAASKIILSSNLAFSKPALVLNVPTPGFALHLLLSMVIVNQQPRLQFKISRP
jgi:hypothetical protein